MKDLERLVKLVTGCNRLCEEWKDLYREEVENRIIKKLEDGSLIEKWMKKDEQQDTNIGTIRFLSGAFNMKKGDGNHALSIMLGTCFQSSIQKLLIKECKRNKEKFRLIGTSKNGKYMIGSNELDIIPFVDETHKIVRVIECKFSILLDRGKTQSLNKRLINTRRIVREAEDGYGRYEVLSVVLVGTKETKEDVYNASKQRDIDKELLMGMKDFFLLFGEKISLKEDILPVYLECWENIEKNFPNKSFRYNTDDVIKYYSKIDEWLTSDWRV